MRVLILRAFALALSALAAAAPAHGSTILILADPMSLERRTVVIEGRGPDRFYWCTLPPGMAGCREITPRRR